MSDRQFLSIWHFFGGMMAILIIQALLDRFFSTQPLWAFVIGGLILWQIWAQVYKFFFRRY